MSEEILKALTELFAIISKQDGGVSEIERNYVINFFKQELDLARVDEYIAQYDKFTEYGEYGAQAEKIEDETKRKSKIALTNVKDSVKTLKICKEINKTLNQKQKVIVLVKLLEMLASDNSFTPQKMNIISTVSDVFNIPHREYKVLERFVKENSSELLDYEDILRFDDEPPPPNSKMHYINSGNLDGEIIFVRVKSVGLYFTKYTGKDPVDLNGIPVRPGAILQFAPGSVFKTPKGAPLYYSDLVSKFNSDTTKNNLSFEVRDVEFRFPSGHIGLRNINLSEGPGKLIGIMGASGAGKTTLLNVMAGLEKPSKGEVLINGYNIHTQKDKIEGVIGYIAQDDLLIEELTVYQNLYYNAKLCFKNLTEEQLRSKVNTTLANLGLDRIANLKVGNVLNKKISGGQRKRLNIALELIREPAVLFVDEPTSGLSSRDSENVMDLLKELSLKGKLIFVVIHQPSSDIYKMFDRMWIMDTGGYPIFYGNPVAAVTYFKTATRQVLAEQGQCPTCGNVNPEQIFNLIEARVVDEYGEFTNKRKISPAEWHELYKKNIVIEPVKTVNEVPPTTLNIPSWFKQTFIFTVRDFLSKISNVQYMTINLIEAPILAVLLSLIIRYRTSGDASYIYRHNENIPAYILICIIIALFMGLTVSAEEIIRDRKIKKREAFLNLSKSAYLFSKLIILFFFSAIQTLSFVLIGNTILDIDGMVLSYWLILFSVSCHANVLGLNISSAFNSAVTVYIIIPLLLIPQMILSGLIFNFDKLNNSIRTRGTVPLLADFMASRWSYEAIAVYQFMSNPYFKTLFPHKAKESQYDYKVVYYLDDEFKDLIAECEELLRGSLNTEQKVKTFDRNLAILNGMIKEDSVLFAGAKRRALIPLERKNFTFAIIDSLRSLESEAHEYYSIQKGLASEAYDNAEYALKRSLVNSDLDTTMDEKLTRLRDRYHNEKLADIVTDKGQIDKFTIEGYKVVQLKDPVYQKPVPSHPLDYRTIFFASQKHFLGRYYDTYNFNLTVIWLMTLFLYIALYFDILSKFMSFSSGISKFFSNLRKK